MTRTLSLYILKQHIGPFLAGMAVITFILVMDMLVDYIDLFLGKGIALGVVAEVFFLSLGWMVALIVPMATLVAALMAFGRLSANNEITAMKAAGMSMWQILSPPIVASIVVAALLVQFNNDVLPDANHRLASLLISIHRKRPALAIKAGAFNNVQGYTIRVEKLNERTSEIESVTIQKNAAGKEEETIIAKRGRLEFTDGGNVLNLYLEDGEIHAVDAKNPDRYQRILFETHTVRITNIGSDLVRSEKKTRGDRELSSADMLERVSGYREEIAKIEAEGRKSISNFIAARLDILHRMGPPEKEKRSIEPFRVREYGRAIRDSGRELAALSKRIDDRQKKIDRYMVEVHKKYALPVACIVFVLLGGPLGIRARRGGLGVGAGFSIAFFVIYYLFLTGGEKLADRGYLPPAVSMWAANVLMGSLGIILIRRSAGRMRFFRFPRAAGRIRLLPAISSGRSGRDAS